MNTTERSAIMDGLEVHDEVMSLVGDRTFHILEQRRKTATIRRRGWLVRRMLLIADLVGLTLAFSLAELLYGVANGPGPNRVNTYGEVLLFVATLPLWVLVTKIYGLYDHDEERTDHTTVDDMLGVFHMATVGTWLLLIGAKLTAVADPDLLKLIAFWGFAIACVTVCRGAARTISRRQITYLQNTVIVGAGDVGQLIARKLLHHPEYGINLVGFVDARPKERRDDLGELTILGPPSRLPAVVRLFDIERVVIAFSNDSHEDTLALIRALKDLDVQIDIVPRLFELVSPGIGIHTVEGLPLFGLPPLKLSRSSRLLKRGMDVLFSLAGLFALAPLFAVLAFLIKRDSPGPVFFRQIRMGTGGRTFRIYKFRTMIADADARKAEFAHLNKHAENGGDPRMFKIPNDPRVTPLGRFLRRFSLDELPQLINVLRGEMSLVGPRPLILDEDQHIADWGRKRLDLKPGITGLWQSLGRSDIPFDEMVKLDYLYVTTWSLWRDLQLVFRTLPAVVKSGDA